MTDRRRTDRHWFIKFLTTCEKKCKICLVKTNYSVMFIETNKR